MRTFRGGLKARLKNLTRQGDTQPQSLFYLHDRSAGEVGDDDLIPDARPLRTNRRGHKCVVSAFERRLVPEPTRELVLHCNAVVPSEAGSPRLPDTFSEWTWSINLDKKRQSKVRSKLVNAANSAAVHDSQALFLRR